MRDAAIWQWVLPDDYGSDHHPVMALVFQ